MRGIQVADIKFINRNDPKEQFAGPWSVFLNTLEGTGTKDSIAKLWSKPPYENVMLKVVRDDVGRHFMNGSCSQRWAEFSGGLANVVEGGRTCWDLYDEALRPFGLTAADTDSEGTFNAFMSVSYDGGMADLSSSRQAAKLEISLISRQRWMYWLLPCLVLTRTKSTTSSPRR